jgi:hypothetical protein
MFHVPPLAEGLEKWVYSKAGGDLQLLLALMGIHTKTFSVINNQPPPPKQSEF